MAIETPSPDPFEFIAKVERAYARLMESARPGQETGLGGALLYAGELDGESRALITAANIAGAASLAATADRAAQKQAIRDGIADFLVNSLDESLRILKNQLRKREPVAVCAGLEPVAVEREMAERGVRPDILRAALFPQVEAQFGITSAESAIVAWSAAAASARWLPKLDALAMECLDENAWRERRWLRLAPRYLGRLAQGFRLVRCAPTHAVMFVEKVRAEAMSGTIGTAIEIRLQYADGHVEHCRIAPHRLESAS